MQTPANCDNLENVSVFCASIPLVSVVCLDVVPSPAVPTSLQQYTRKPGPEQPSRCRPHV